MNICDILYFDKKGGGVVTLEVFDIHNYNNQIVTIISNKMKLLGLTQIALINQCAELGVNISAGTLSNYLKPNHAKDMKLSFIVAICKALELDLTEVLSIKNETEKPDEKKIWTLTGLDHSDWIFSDPKHDAFRGYIGRTFDIFFLSTVSKERKLIQGTMRLTDKDNYCAVKIVLPIDAHLTKEYVGSMIVSTKQHACYCIVGSKELGEMCSIVFFYKNFNADESFAVRLATVNTVSAGDDQSATIHRMVICKQGTINSEEKKQFVLSQLRMNRAQIIVSASVFNALKQEDGMQEVFSLIASRLGEAHSYYSIDEDDILNLRKRNSNIEFSKWMNALTQIRIESVAHRYNKIGKKADKILYDYLFRKQKGE
jgi:DNA-binding Xre family transcriptional regulator